jgi:aspartate ammonia-lyase
MDYRVEKDYLGELEVPSEAYYGIQTVRAVKNFPITGVRLDADLIRALGIIKYAAAEANAKNGGLDKKTAEVILQAAQEVIEGKFNDQFIVDPVQGGAGTSINMNINEVIANRAIELLNGRKGDYSLVSPNSHVNMSQSTNDVVPTAVRIAALSKTERLLKVVSRTVEILRQKSDEFDDCVKMGRTHLQDAVPIRLGQEFGAYASAVKRARDIVLGASLLLKEINMGATAIGTCLNADPVYVSGVIESLRRLSGFDLSKAGDLVDATQNSDIFVQVSSSLKHLVIVLSKIANDLRLMSSGPRCGFNEIHLPEVQPGSSIMPGKVNPVMAEVMNQVAFQIIGNDVTINLAAEAGQLELNVMVPVLYYNLFQSYDLITNSLNVFTCYCLAGIRPNRKQCRSDADKSIGIVTALNPYIGYEQSCQIAREALHSGKTVSEIAVSKELLSRKQVEEILNPAAMTSPEFPGRPLSGKNKKRLTIPGFITGKS